MVYTLAMAEGPVRDFLGTDDGEIAVVNGDFGVVRGPDAVPQGIAVRLRLFRRECLIDESKGVPYLDDEETGEEGILTRPVDPLVVREVLREQVADTPDVIDVTGSGLVTDSATREAFVDFEAATVYGDQPIAGQVSVP